MPDPRGCVTIEFSEKKGPHKQECECIWAKYFVKTPLTEHFIVTQPLLENNVIEILFPFG